MVSDSRSESTNFEEWLQMIKLLSNNSPVIILQNEKYGQVEKLDRNYLKTKFSGLIEIMQCDLKSNRGLETFIKEMEYQVQKLQYSNRKIPKEWMQVRNKLREKSEKNYYISFKEYHKICEENKIIDWNEIGHLIQYLHDLGIVIHFHNNPILEKIVILNPKWVTDAIYKLLRDSTIIVNRGVFNKKDINRIWDEKIYQGVRNDLLEIVMKFKMCYKIENKSQYIIPQLLSERQPDFLSLEGHIYSVIL